MTQAISEQGQHDDHCRLTFKGKDWWIAGIMPGEGGAWILLTGDSGKMILDTSHVDWPSYEDACRRLMDAKWR